MSTRTLTEEQRFAVDWNGGSLLLSANAGSGKTSVLVERFARAVLEQDIAPSRLLVITFTERAAGELAHRVRERLLGAGARAAARDTEAAMIVTIHGFCARVLRANPLVAGIDPAFVVLDEGDAQELRTSAFEYALASVLASEFADAALELLAANGVDRISAQVRGTYDELRSRGQTRPTLPPPPPAGPDVAELTAQLCVRAAALLVEMGAAEKPGKTVLAALATLERCITRGERITLADVAQLRLKGRAKPLATDLAAAYEQARRRAAQGFADQLGAAALAAMGALLLAYGERYALLKHARGALDFDDLELNVRDLLLGNEALRARWAQRFELIMVDELQDTNARQIAIVEALERDNALCVGDEFQSIYGFRHADVEIFRSRRDGPGESAALSVNFRSQPEILDAVNAVFAGYFKERFIPLVAGRTEAPASEPLVELLLSDRGAPVDRELDPDFHWRQEEARRLAARVAQLIGEGVARPGEVAVLLRAASDLDVYRAALEAQGLATIAASRGGFFKRQEIVDVLAYLGALANPSDEPALCGALVSPLVGLSADALVILARDARARGVALATHVLHAGVEQLAAQDRERLELFRTRFVAQRADAQLAGVDELLLRVVNESGYERQLNVVALENVRRLARLARVFEQEHGRALRGFVDRATQGALSGGPALGASAPASGNDAVALMTIHAAKGLEFPVVCVADLGRQTKTTPPMLICEGERIGIRGNSLDGERGWEAFAYPQLAAERVAAALAEEQRIVYVAMTRARERLILSGAVDFARWPAPSDSAPLISWLAPALIAEIETLVGEAQPQSILDFGTHRVRLCLNAGDAQPPAAVSSAPVPVPGPPPLRPRVAPGAPAPPPATLSYTALSAYASCGYAYYLRRVLGLRDVVAPRGGDVGSALAPLVRGRIVHELLEHVDFAAPRTPTDAELSELLRAHGAKPNQEVLADLRALVENFAAAEICARLGACGTVRREYAFTLALGGEQVPLLTGVVDVFAQLPEGGVLVLDYKSDRLGAREPAALVSEAYSRQRDAYALAALQGGTAVVEVAYCFLERPNELVSTRFVAAQADELRERLRAAADDFAQQRFAVAAQPHLELCGTCPGRAQLCSWDETMTLRAARTLP